MNSDDNLHIEDDSLLSQDSLAGAPTPMAYSARGSMINSQASMAGGNNNNLLNKFSGFMANSVAQSQPVKQQRYNIKIPGEKPHNLDSYFKSPRESPQKQKKEIDATQSEMASQPVMPLTPMRPA